MNAVIYARYSSHAQTEQSIDGQLRICHDYARREGYSVVGEYIDRALTGRNDDRPDFHNMINDSAKEQFQYIIVYKLDRFARNRYDSAIYKRKLKLNGVRVLSAEECIGDNPESIILEAVLEASAEYYSVDLAQKITRGMTDSAMKGQFLGGGVPLGYKNIDRRLVVDPDTAPFVKWAFEQYASGTSMKAIVDGLNARGLRNRRGNPYRLQAFQDIFANKKYIGIMQWKDIIIEDAIPPIIDRATFDAVQNRISRNKHNGGRRGDNPVKIEYLLTGKVFCGLCGSRVASDCGRSASNGNMYHYYACANKKKGAGCQKRNEKKDFLEWYVCEQSVEYVLTPPRQRVIAAAVVEQYRRDFDVSKATEMERQISRLQREIERLVDQSIEAPKSARQIFYNKIERADALKNDVQIDLAKLRIATDIQLTEDEIIAWLRSFCKGDLFDLDFRRRIIDVFVHSVYLYDDKIVIWYNIKGGKQVSHMELLDAIDENTKKEEFEPSVESSNSIGFGGA